MADDTRIIFPTGAEIQLPDGVTIDDVIEAATRLQRQGDMSVSEISPLPEIPESSGNVRPFRRREVS